MEENGEDIRLNQKSGLVFSNILGFKKRLAALPQGKNVTIDVSEARIIDHTSMLTLNGFSADYKEAKGTVKVIGFQHHTQLSKANTSTRLLKISRR